MEDDLLFLPTLRVIPLSTYWELPEPLPVEEGMPEIEIAEYCSMRTTTLLPILFADHPGDEMISPRYRTFTDADDARDYSDTSAVWEWDGDEYAKYYELPNVIGYRLAHYHDATIGLRGGYSSEPGESPDVAHARAASVRDYLTRVLKIEPERITLLEPQRLSDSSDRLLRHEEARCVMIETEEWEIVRPVRHVVRGRSIDNARLRFEIDPLVPPDRVKRVSVVLSIGDLVVGEAGMEGHPDSLLYRRDGWWSSFDDRIDATDGAVMITAHVTMSDGHVRRSQSVALPIRYEPCDPPRRSVGIDNIAFPFFAYHDTLLSPYQERFLRNLVDDYDTAAAIQFEITEEIEYSEGEGAENVRWDTYQIGRLEEMRAWQQISTDNQSAGRLRFDEPEDNLPLQNERGHHHGPYIDLIDIDAAEKLQTLGEARAHIVGDFLRDSLGVHAVDPMWVAEWRKKEREKSERADRDLLLREPLRRIPHMSYSDYHIRPEERWYHRFVTLRIAVNEEAEEKIKVYR